MDADSLVTSADQVRQNVRTLYGFAKGSALELKFHRSRIKNGKNFVALAGEPHFQFAPSKFAGYVGNGLHHADRLHQRDGRQTDLQISRLIGKPVEKGDPGYAAVDREFEGYCSAHGITPSRHPRARRYWVL